MVSNRVHFCATIAKCDWACTQPALTIGQIFASALCRDGWHQAPGAAQGALCSSIDAGGVRAVHACSRWLCGSKRGGGCQSPRTCDGVVGGLSGSSGNIASAALKPYPLGRVGHSSKVHIPSFSRTLVQICRGARTRAPLRRRGTAAPGLTNGSGVRLGAESALRILSL
jgi:hypothetical protein